MTTSPASAQPPSPSTPSGGAGAQPPSLDGSSPAPESAPAADAQAEAPAPEEPPAEP